MPGTFSLLAGVWLSDQSEPDHGNLWVWPGSHLRAGDYFAEHGADAITRVDELGPGPYPRVDLGAPTQAVGPAGSLLFAHYLLAHNIGGHDGPAHAAWRRTLYYRLVPSGTATLADGRDRSPARVPVASVRSSEGRVGVGGGGAMLQLELIERVKAVCRADPGLDAALMYGSFTKDEADEHSDIEFWLFFTKPRATGSTRPRGARGSRRSAT